MGGGSCQACQVSRHLAEQHELQLLQAVCRMYLLVEPSWPLVGDKLVLKAIVLSHERQETLHLRGTCNS